MKKATTIAVDVAQAVLTVHARCSPPLRDRRSPIGCAIGPSSSTRASATIGQRSSSPTSVRAMPGRWRLERRASRCAGTKGKVKTYRGLRCDKRR